MTIWYVAAGGAVGSVARLLLGAMIQERTGGSFPLGTLVINITGSFLLGMFMSYSTATPTISREVRVMLTAGFCGGFTTFSAFSYETIQLMQGGDYRGAGLYVALSVLGSLAGAIAGFAAVS
jgi:fluoride exporter